MSKNAKNTNVVLTLAKAACLCIGLTGLTLLGLALVAKYMLVVSLAGGVTGTYLIMKK